MELVLGVDALNYKLAKGYCFLQKVLSEARDSSEVSPYLARHFIAHTHELSYSSFKIVASSLTSFTRSSDLTT